MKVENLSIALRPRTAWEAMDLGGALTRRHARTIWLAWFALTLPALVLANALCWFAFGEPWAAWLLMWWLKPAFDRVPLYVLSRAVFGEAPGVRETLRAQWRWGMRAMLPWLFYRRFFSMNRALVLPVDLLEGSLAAGRGARVRVLVSGEGTQGIMLTIIALHVEAMLAFSLVGLALILVPVPVQFMGDTAKAFWETLVETPPAWAQALVNCVGWLATSIIEPFYVGAGFGLYLNRRTHLEAWDIELAFRRLAARLAAPALAVVLALACVPQAVHADEAPAKEVAAQADDEADEADDTNRLDHVGGRAKPAPVAQDAKAGERPIASIFGSTYVKGGDDFSRSVAKAYEEPALSGKRTQRIWKPIGDDRPTTDRERSSSPAWARAIGGLFAIVAEYGLYILLAVLVYFLVRARHIWLPWLKAAGAIVRGSALPPPLVTAIEAPPEPDIPDDLDGAVRALWQRGEPRAALALLYRAGVQALVEARGESLPPGATESECLRAARALRGWPRLDGFVRVVASWRAAAYARRFPDAQQLDALLAAFRAGKPA